MKPVAIALTVNGRSVSAAMEPRTTLAGFVRDTLDLTGTHIGCSHGVCGACTVRLDGLAVRGCLVLAASADGRRVETIEGVSDTGAIAALQAAFLTHGGLQCGFCTPGMLLTAAELLAENPHPSREEIREALSGNYCRCTGYGPIVEAVAAAARAVANAESGGLDAATGRT